MLRTTVLRGGFGCTILSLATVACIPVGGFDGEIDGDAMPLQLTALYGHAKSNDDVRFTQIVGLSFAVPCDRYAQWAEDRNDIMKDFNESDRDDNAIDDAAADLEKGDVELGVPEEWWSVSVSVFDDDDLDDGDFDAFGEKDALVDVSIAHQTERPDYQRLLEKGSDPNADSFIAVDGTITLADIVEDTSLRLTSDELDLADAEDFADDGEDAEPVGSGTLTLSASHCADFSDAIEKALDGLAVTVGDPAVEDPPVDEPPVGDQCASASDCANIACICDDGSALGTPVNTSNCSDQSCDSPAQACPTSCESFGFPWSGDVVDTTEPPDEPPPGETGTCEGHLGTADGCDCGCGSFDSDCASSAADICEFNNCVSGAPSLTDNASCG